MTPIMPNLYIHIYSEQQPIYNDSNNKYLYLLETLLFNTYSSTKLQLLCTTFYTIKQ